MRKLSVFNAISIDGYFEGADGPAMREEGWSKLLDQLTDQLTEKLER